MTLVSRLSQMLDELGIILLSEQAPLPLLRAQLFLVLVETAGGVRLPSVDNSLLPIAPANASTIPSRAAASSPGPGRPAPCPFKLSSSFAAATAPTGGHLNRKDENRTSFQPISIRGREVADSSRVWC